MIIDKLISFKNKPIDFPKAEMFEAINKCKSIRPS